MPLTISRPHVLTFSRFSRPHVLTSSTANRHRGLQKRDGGLVLSDSPAVSAPVTRSQGIHSPVLLPAATAWTVTPAGGHWELRLPSPSGLAGPQGSPVRALRVGSGRGPTLRTAPRGARSEWVKHATGFTCSSRGDHQDQRRPEPLVASAFSPDIPLKPASWPPL